MIDLDLVPPADTAPWQPSRRQRLALRLVRRAARPVGYAALVVAAAMTLGAAARPAAPAMTRVLSAGGVEAADAETRGVGGGAGANTAKLADSLLAPPVLFTVETAATVEGPAVVRARPLAPGATRWTSRVRQGEDALTLTLRSAAGVLVVGGDGPSTFLDAATGAMLWRSDATVSVGEDSVLLVTPGSDDGPERMRAVDLRTGRTLWSRTGPHVPTVGLDDAGQVVTVDGAGRATTYRLADGRVLATADLGFGPQLWDSYDEDNFAGAAVVGGRLFVHGKVRRVPFLRAYRPGTLELQWQSASPLFGMPDDCAGSLCVSGDAGLVVLDPRDGSTRWSDPAWDNATTAPAAGQIVVTNSDQTRTALVEVADGRVVRSLGDGVVRAGLLLRPKGGAGAEPAGAGTAGAGTDTRPGRTWVTDLVTGRVFGIADRVTAAGCVAGGGYLSCPRADGDGVLVWRVRATSAGDARPPAGRRRP